MVRPASLPLLAALLLAAGGARDDRFPRRAADPPQVSGCDAFGPGYRAIAGTDTCVRLSGSVGVEMRLSTGDGGRAAGAYMAAPRR